jgi:hypothetical protein
MFENKRGQGLSTNAIILIVLGIFVLVILILGFTMGWDKISPFIDSDNNIDLIVQQCSIACSTNSVYDYCTKKRVLTPEDSKLELEDVDCNYLARNQTKYGIELCSSISCSAKIVGDNDLDLKSHCTPETNGKFIQSLVSNKLESYECIAS